jgi:hypothetical protein
MWDAYPSDYRSAEISSLLRAVQAGQSAAVIGLSGAGKSNLMGFLAQRGGPERLPSHHFGLVDFNRLAAQTPEGVYDLLHGCLRPEQPSGGTAGLSTLEAALEAALTTRLGVCLLLDRFDALGPSVQLQINGSLRALRDAFKYRLSYIIASRRPIDPRSELAELFFAHTLWLGPLSPSDARWSARRDLLRFGLPADDALVDRLVELTWGYPSFLRAAVEACASGASLKEIPLHPAVQRRVAEFWSDEPTQNDLELARLAGHPWLAPQPTRDEAQAADLTAKEYLLWAYLQAHPGQVCSKDELIRAVWPEDKVYLEGIRDDSLAQLVRRLRKKVELEPDQPQRIQTVPGRGYILKA